MGSVYINSAEILVGQSIKPIFNDLKINYDTPIGFYYDYLGVALEVDNLFVADYDEDFLFDKLSEMGGDKCLDINNYNFYSSVFFATTRQKTES